MIHVEMNKSVYEQIQIAVSFSACVKRNFMLCPIRLFDVGVGVVVVAVTK